MRSFTCDTLNALQFSHVSSIFYIYKKKHKILLSKLFFTLPHVCALYSSYFYYLTINIFLDKKKNHICEKNNLGMRFIFTK